MLEHGYSMREVTEAYTDQNLFARDIKVPELVKIYEDKVLSRVNDERKKRSGQNSTAPEMPMKRIGRITATSMTIMMTLIRTTGKAKSSSP